MDKPQVIFIDLSVANKLRYVCDIVEKFFLDELTITVFVKDAAEARNLDQRLWTWKQDSFIPHSIQNQPPQERSEAVIITSEDNAITKSDAIILYDPLDSSKLEHFRWIIDFAETYNSQQLQQSRQRFRELRDSGNFNLDYQKLGPFLSQSLTKAVSKTA